MVGRKYISGHKKALGKATAVSEACYGCEVWLAKTEEQSKLLALDRNGLFKDVRVSRLQNIPTTTIRSKIQAEQSILDSI